MKKLILLAVVAVALTGCADVHKMSDYELCETMSGQTWNASQSGEAATEAQSRANAGVMTIAPRDCAQIAYMAAQKAQANAMVITQTLNQQAALQAQQAAPAPSNDNMTCSAFGNTMNCHTW
ncbi:hypothetical protein OL383_004419 [Salmonella enterica]|nr:hypothetical protein [Salmonella enterica]